MEAGDVSRQIAIHLQREHRTLDEGERDAGRSRDCAERGDADRADQRAVHQW
jgi:hypothetical protein